MGKLFPMAKEIHNSYTCKVTINCYFGSSQLNHQILNCVVQFSQNICPSVEFFPFKRST